MGKMDTSGDLAGEGVWEGKLSIRESLWGSGDRYGGSWVVGELW